MTTEKPESTFITIETKDPYVSLEVDPAELFVSMIDSLVENTRLRDKFVGQVYDIMEAISATQKKQL
jgi:hypothetical protein